jgi:hypothetical protein
LVTLYSLDLDEASKRVTAKWRMEGNLQLPWRPVIDVQGVTEYSFSEESGGRIERYYERWTQEPGAALLSLLRPAADKQVAIAEKCQRLGSPPAILIPEVEASLLKMQSGRDDPSALVPLLEMHDTAQPPPLLELVAGTSWRLVFTDAKGGSNGVIGGIKGQVTQKFDKEASTKGGAIGFSNIVSFLSGLVEIDLRAQVEERNPKQPENFTESPRVGSFEKSEPQRLSLSRLFETRTVRQKLQWMTYAELRAEETRVAALPFKPEAKKDHARAVMKVRLTVQEKFNTALAILSFALIGVPLGIKVSRRETSANLGVAVLLALGYYMLTVAVSWLDRHPEYHPDLLFWLPNAVFLSLGVWLFLRIERR